MGGGGGKKKEVFLKKEKLGLWNGFFGLKLGSWEQIFDKSCVLAGEFYQKLENN